MKGSLSFSQSTFTFIPYFGGKEVLGKAHVLLDDDSILFETFRFYISGIELWKDGKLVWKEKKSYHLIDAANISSQKIALNTGTAVAYDQIKFNLGIDSTTNVSGALGGDLDPTKGMYWTWNSGYINLKLEGKFWPIKKPVREFQFHLGGYLSPFNALQKITLDVDKKPLTVIRVNISAWIIEADLLGYKSIMTPGKESVELSVAAVKMFSVIKP